MAWLYSPLSIAGSFLFVFLYVEKKTRQTHKDYLGLFYFAAFIYFGRDGIVYFLLLSKNFKGFFVKSPRDYLGSLKKSNEFSIVEIVNE